MSSFFAGFQVDPATEVSAGPKFVFAGDIDNDGMIDLVTAWNDSQTVQLHLQRRTAGGSVAFRTINLGGTAPIFNIAGLQLGNIRDGDWLDVVVLSRIVDKACRPGADVSNIIVVFNPRNAAAVTDGDQWSQMVVGNPNDAGSLAVGNIDGRAGDDILVAGDTVELWINPRPDRAADNAANWDLAVQLMCGDPAAAALTDVDGDGDPDVVVSSPNLGSGNVRWLRNPLIPQGVAAVTEGFAGGRGTCGGRVDGEECECDIDCFIPDGTCVNGSCVGGATPGADCTDSSACRGKDEACLPGPCGIFDIAATEWEVRPIGHVAGGADRVAIGDLDGDGFEDVVVGSIEGGIVQWFRHPCTPLDSGAEPEFPPNNCPTPERLNFTWPVFTLTDTEPQAIALGDLTGNGRNEAVIASGGGIAWYEPSRGSSVFVPWRATTIVQRLEESTVEEEPADDVETLINGLGVVDLNDDGRNDIVGTFDREGLSIDTVIWFRSTRR